MIDLFEELTAITGVLNSAAIPHALVGGLAYSVWVEVRGTEDIDLLIAPEDWERTQQLMIPLGFEHLAAPMDFDLIMRRLTKMSDGDALSLDFLFADGDLRRGLDERVAIEHAGQVYFVAPIEVIIDLKRRRLSSQDRVDIEGLEKRLGEGES